MNGVDWSVVSWSVAFRAFGDNLPLSSLRANSLSHEEHMGTPSWVCWGRVGEDTWHVNQAGESWIGPLPRNRPVSQISSPLPFRHRPSKLWSISLLTASHVWWVWLGRVLQRRKASSEQMWLTGKASLSVCFWRETLCMPVPAGLTAEQFKQKIQDQRCLQCLQILKTPVFLVVCCWIQYSWTEIWPYILIKPLFSGHVSLDSQTELCPRLLSLK